MVHDDEPRCVPRYAAPPCRGQPARLTTRRGNEVSLAQGGCTEPAHPRNGDNPRETLRRGRHRPVSQLGTFSNIELGAPRSGQRAPFQYVP